MIQETAAPKFRFRDDQRAQTWVQGLENRECKPHFHQCAEIVYVSEGVMEAWVDSEFYPVAAGEMLVVSSYSTHRYFTPEHSVTICALFPLRFLPARFSMLESCAFKTVRVQCPAPEVVWCAQTLLRHKNAMSEDALRCLSAFAVQMLMDTVGLTERISRDMNDITRRIIIYLQDNFTRDISLADLAAEMNYSTSRMSHLFHDAFHCSFSEFFNGLRCKYASQLLAESEMSVLDISMAVGYECLRSFYRAFRREYHMPPLQYREKRMKRVREGAQGEAIDKNALIGI